MILRKFVEFDEIDGCGPWLVNPEMVSCIIPLSTPGRSLICVSGCEGGITVHLDPWDVVSRLGIYEYPLQVTIKGDGNGSTPEERA